MKVLIIIPAYNESENLDKVISGLQESVPLYDYIIVNDCSTDNMEKICKQKGYNYLSLPINLGIGGGVQTGYKYALAHDYDIAIQHDGDGQHDARFIQDVVKPFWERGRDKRHTNCRTVKEGV